jgi:hypothetical protein
MLDRERRHLRSVPPLSDSDEEPDPPEPEDPEPPDEELCVVLW